MHSVSSKSTKHQVKPLAITQTSVRRDRSCGANGFVQAADRVQANQVAGLTRPIFCIRQPFSGKVLYFFLVDFWIFSGPRVPREGIKTNAMLRPLAMIWGDYTCLRKPAYDRQGC